MPHELRWYAVYTASRAEKKVKERFDVLGIENFLPIQMVLRQWTHRKQKVLVPVIPGMIFVRTTKDEQLKVLQTKGVVAFLRLRGEKDPAVIPDKQMEDFKFLLDYSEESIEITNEYIEIGDFIVVVKGPLKGMEGELVQLKGVTKVVVRLEMLGNAIVNIPATFVESIR